MGLSLPTVALLAMAWLVHQSSGQFDNSFNWVMKTYKVMDLFEQTQASIVDAEANQRGYLLTGRQDFLGPYQTAIQSIRDKMAELNKMTATDPAQQANLAMLEKMVDEELVFDPDKAFPAGRSPADLSVITVTEQGKQKLERMRRLLFQAHQEQQNALSKHEQKAAEDMMANQVTSLVLIAAVAMALILVVVILLRLEKLQEFVTVCAWTGQVRFQGQWLRLDEYLKRRFGITVSHSMSEEAAEKMMNEIEELNRKGGPPPIVL